MPPPRGRTRRETGSAAEGSTSRRTTSQRLVRLATKRDGTRTGQAAATTTLRARTIVIGIFLYPHNYNTEHRPHLPLLSDSNLRDRHLLETQTIPATKNKTHPTHTPRRFASPGNKNCGEGEVLVPAGFRCLSLLQREAETKKSSDIDEAARVKENGDATKTPVARSAVSGAGAPSDVDTALAVAVGAKGTKREQGRERGDGDGESLDAAAERARMEVDSHARHVSPSFLFSILSSLPSIRPIERRTHDYDAS
ncbi:hypothetical protein MSAN_02325700 [Mycena sanguinolenta]|uniref:Uncharacterized protein n=1 Tax=Mycena sanguinolenta TaxID=230812 RepID=A0A8H6X854_9AGAR|nr:hypothetical protein MSAN_02325700 [Mycena sanguinolenta]